jgi:hypothetical protein
MAAVAVVQVVPGKVASMVARVVTEYYRHLMVFQLLMQEVVQGVIILQHH